MLSAAALHFAALLTVCLLGTGRLIQDGLTILPARPATSAAPAPAAGESRNALRPVALTYLHLAGIEAGYGYFAPNIPPAYRLTIELLDKDGTVERGVLSPRRGETGVRLASFLDAVGRRPAGDVRDIMFQLMGKSLLAEHPAAVRLDVTVERIRQAKLAEAGSAFEPGFELAYGYTFTRETTGQLIER